MKRPNMLSATFCKNVKNPGRYGDGRGGFGLSLLVRTAARGHTTKCWTQSVRIGRRPTSIGLTRRSRKMTAKVARNLMSEGWRREKSQTVVWREAGLCRTSPDRSSSVDDAGIGSVRGGEHGPRARCQLLRKKRLGGA